MGWRRKLGSDRGPPLTLKCSPVELDGGRGTSPGALRASQGPGAERRWLTEKQGCGVYRQPHHFGPRQRIVIKINSLDPWAQKTSRDREIRFVQEEQTRSNKFSLCPRHAAIKKILSESYTWSGSFLLMRCLAVPAHQTRKTLRNRAGRHGEKVGSINSRQRSTVADWDAACWDLHLWTLAKRGYCKVPCLCQLTRRRNAAPPPNLRHSLAGAWHHAGVRPAQIIVAPQSTP